MGPGGVGWGKIEGLSCMLQSSDVTNTTPDQVPSLFMFCLHMYMYSKFMLHI